MTKSFADNINRSNDKKRIQNLTRDNEKLAEDLRLANQKSEELKNVMTHLNDEIKNQEPVTSIKLNKIKLRDNIRNKYEFENIPELAKDINQNGQLQAVLLSLDDYLLAGFRRYYSMGSIDKNFDVLITRYPKNNKDISEVELKEIQYAENNERRNIDNFQLSELFNWYLDQGFTQKDLVEKFKKNKGTISSIVTISKINPAIQTLLKEIQTFGASRAKFGAPNLNDSDKQKFLEKVGLIGYQPLYKIAKEKDLLDQVKVFIKLFKDKLTEEELKDLGYQEPEKQVISVVDKLKDTVDSELNKWFKANPDKSEIFKKVKNKIAEALAEL